MTNEQDLPESEHWGLVYPFIACQSNGGAYDDEAFTAGFSAGRIDQVLVVAATLNADRVELRFTVRTGLVPQLELIAMARGFPSIAAQPWDEHPDEWTFLTLATSDEEQR